MNTTKESLVAMKVFSFFSIAPPKISILPSPMCAEVCPKRAKTFESC